MKTNPTIISRNTRRAAMLIAFFGIAVSFTACKHDDIQQPEAIAALAITNAATAAPSLDFYLDNQRVNSNALLFGQKINYINALAGIRNGTVTSSNIQQSLYSKNFELAFGQYHSLYIVSQGDSISYVLLRDSITAADGKAKVRFINLSADSQSFNLELEGDTATFTDRAFKQATPFKGVAPAKYKITLKDKATNLPVATLADVNLEQDKFYTIWAKGLKNTTVNEQKLAIQVDQH